MTHVSEWLIISQYCDLRVSWSANHISPEICFIWPLIGQNFIWSILIGQMQNGQFLLVKTDLLDDCITVSRNTSNTDFNNESYCINHKWWVISMMHSLWLIIIQSETLFDCWKVFDCNKGISFGEKPPTKNVVLFAWAYDRFRWRKKYLVAWSTGWLKAICLFVQRTGWNIWKSMIGTLDLVNLINAAFL